MSALRSTGSTRRWRRLRQLVLDRDGSSCQLPGELPARPGSWADLYRPGTTVCGAYADHVDHVVARVRGGGDDGGNLRAACPPHNLQRGAALEDVRPSNDKRPTPGRWDW